MLDAAGVEEAVDVDAVAEIISGAVMCGTRILVVVAAVRFVNVLLKHICLIGRLVSHAIDIVLI